MPRQRNRAVERGNLDLTIGEHRLVLILKRLQIKPDNNIHRLRAVGVIPDHQLRRAGLERGDEDGVRADLVVFDDVRLADHDALDRSARGDDCGLVDGHLELAVGQSIGDEVSAGVIGRSDGRIRGRVGRGRRC